MIELESVIERRLIEKLCEGDSQWTYRKDIDTEEKLWENFKYILEQNNKAKLNGTPLTESEFAKIKNDISHATFYDAAKWLVGENGKVYVHVQRGNETLHLVVLNNEHIAGGSSVYEVINQYRVFKAPDDENGKNRRFDVTLLINGIPLIHIELKNKEHAYLEGFNQIKKYIKEGKFRGLFSNVQMFVVSNVIDTKYFSAAGAEELNPEFMTGWIDRENKPVTDYIEFTRSVLRIPNAHEMVTKYTVLDNDKKKLLILRPYQIHAIEAMREASKIGESGYIWHTTGSGKTMTSYKATRNLLMDIPSIQKTIFLIDRKDLDVQTKMAFQSYADNDTIDVDDTENVDSLIKKISDDNRQMIVTTRQKLQIMINKRLKEGTKLYDKICSLKVAFVVDECHRAVTPETKREIERFFRNSLWYGFTGTPIFDENKYEKRGDLAQTTSQLYGECLHSYTIKEAIHDKAVLGFMVENLGPTKIEINVEPSVMYSSENHMRRVLNVILNMSKAKFGMQNGKGRTYEAILTVGSIALAQKYYLLLKKIKEGNDELKINENIYQSLPDFPKFAITYSLSENEETSGVNQELMKESIKDYNEMFGTNYGLDNIGAYNSNLNDRLARKEKKYLDRSQQLDLVIVVDRLLTGFDAPCLSTLFMDRQPMTPQNIIQAFSRTNRLYDGTKEYGQIVTFQSPNEFKENINNAIKLYSKGGDGNPIAEDFDTVKENLSISIKAVHALAPAPDDVMNLSREKQKAFVRLFRVLDKDFSHLKAFSNYEPSILNVLEFSQDEYEDYAAVYKNLMAIFHDSKNNLDEDDDIIRDDYELKAYSKFKIDFDYIIEILQGAVDMIEDIKTDNDEERFYLELASIRAVIEEYMEDNEKNGKIFEEILSDIEANKDKYIHENISVVINDILYSRIDALIGDFAKKWFLNFDDVKYEVYNYKYGELENANKLKESIDYEAYEKSTDNPMKKFKFRVEMIKDFKENLMYELDGYVR
ncbi:type I restriction enzyme, R subunit [Lachnospiraceae bacterium RM5]|nr:type I restriction enzyme, R subunit [Lachnospiraceae bacterium RM5]